MIARKKLILVFIIFFTGSAVMVKSQPAYVNTQQGIFQLTGGIGSSDLALINNICGVDNNILSIAVYKDTIYYSTWGGELKRFKIGVPGSCEVLIESGFSYNSMTVDKNGIIYMGTELLARYDPHSRQLSDLGRMPFFSEGDMFFYKDKLLLAGWDPYDWSTGIYEINPDNLAASKLFMITPGFIGLLSYPSPCGNNRYFGLTCHNTGNTELVELDLANKLVLGNTSIIPLDILDAGSITEIGTDDQLTVNSVVKTHPDNCANNNGRVLIAVESGRMPVTFTLITSGLTQSSGDFKDLRPGIYQFHISDARGCTKDTMVTLAENIPVGGCNEIFIPNAFTPNFDGKNDVFKPYVPSAFKDVLLQVFNRWGNIVYQSKGGTIAWNGDYNGIEQPPGVYVYFLNYSQPDGQRKNIRGTLNLIR